MSEESATGHLECAHPRGRDGLGGLEESDRSGQRRQRRAHVGGRLTRGGSDTWAGAWGGSRGGGGVSWGGSRACARIAASSAVKSEYRRGTTRRRSAHSVPSRAEPPSPSPSPSSPSAPSSSATSATSVTSMWYTVNSEPRASICRDHIEIAPRCAAERSRRENSPREVAERSRRENSPRWRGAPASSDA